jgi:hypothetical protein
MLSTCAKSTADRVGLRGEEFLATSVRIGVGQDLRQRPCDVFMAGDGQQDPFMNQFQSP